MAQFREHRTLPRWVHLPTVHFYIYVLPILGLIADTTLWALIRVRADEFLTVYAQIQSALADGAATWAGGVPLGQVLALQPLSAEVQARSDRMTAAISHGYACASTWLVLYYIVAFPCAVIQVATLYRQIRHLRQTAEYASRNTRSEGSRSSGSGGHRRTISSVERKARKLIYLCCASSSLPDHQWL
jgi:hypothetical protein